MDDTGVRFVGLQRPARSMRAQVLELVKRAELEHGVRGVEVCEACEWHIADWIRDCGADVAAREVVPTVEACTTCQHQFYRRDLREPEDVDGWDDPDLGKPGACVESAAVLLVRCCVPKG